MPTLSLAIDSTGAVVGAQAFNASAGSVERSARSATLGTQAMRLGIASVGVAGAAAAVAIGTQLVRSTINQTREMVRLASAAQEVDNKFRVVFGDSTGLATRELEQLAEQAGRSELSLRRAASGIQDILVPLGIQRDVAAGLSLDLSRLAVDVASFNDAQDADVAQRFSSALVGNSEAVRIYGINLQETAVQQEAVRLGLAESTKELSNQDKVLARASLLFRNSSDAIGDAERSADSYANTIKRVEGAIEDAQVAAGERLTGAFARAINGGDRMEAVLLAIDASLGKIADTAATASFALGVVFDEALEETGFASVLRFRRMIERIAGENQAAAGGTPDNPVEGLGSPPLSIEDRNAGLLDRRNDLRSALGRSRADRLQDVLTPEATTADTLVGKLGLTRTYRREIEQLEEALKEQIETERRLAQESQDAQRQRLEASQFVQDNRLLVTGLESGLGNFSSAIGAAASDLSSLEDAGRSALQGIIFDLARASSEALIFKGLIEPLLVQSGGGGASFASLLGQGLGIATSYGGGGLGNSSRQGGGAGGSFGYSGEFFRSYPNPGT